ncbi:MAG TPA: methyl-accepting chemotaxis protein [Geobacteraceae bacterium]|nr:methyl-accepting chemotaxis protein [Geobacteraceae bacterium]
MKTSSLSRKFLARVLLLLLAGQIISLAWIYKERKKVEEGELNRRAKILAVMVSKSAERSILDNYDFTYLTILTNEILNDEDIISVTVRDGNGKEFVFARNDRGAPASSAFAVSPISTRLGETGKVSIIYTFDNIRKGLLGHVLLLFLMQGIIFLALVMLIRYFFRRDLGNRINLVGKVIGDVRDGNLLTRINYGDTDEIGEIADGFDFLVGNLADAIGKMRMISGNLTSATGIVDHTLQQMAGKAERQHKTTNAIFRSIDDTSNSQLRTLENTDRLLALSRENGIALEGIKTTFEGVTASVDRLDGSVGALYSSISELSNSAADVAALAESATRAVKDASVKMESINASVGEIDTIVKDSACLSRRVSEAISGKGIVAVTDTVDTMERIESFFNNLSGTIARLEASSGYIAKILIVIREVTEQAHLLSLNAQLIAAQAGVHGRSFGVVANEMKILSAKASDSAGEIEQIITTIQKEMRSAVNATAETALNVSRGKSVVADAGEVLGGILGASSQFAEMMKRVSDSTLEQNSLIKTVFKDISMLRDLNEKVKTATEEEKKEASLLFSGIKLICESMGETRKATQEQAQALKTIVGNMESANSMTEEIAAASLDQQKVNTEIILSMNDALQLGGEMVEAVREVSGGIRGFHQDVERLQKEMEFFRTEENAVLESEAVADQNVLKGIRRHAVLAANGAA